MSRAQALHKLMIVISLLLALLITVQGQAAETIQHKMQVEIQPSLKMLKAQDTLTFPPNIPRKLTFLLHRDLQITITSPDDTLTVLHQPTKLDPYTEYGLTLGSQDNKVSLNFYGVINDPIVNDHSTGLISPEGATLFGSTYWYPFFLNYLTAFEISIQTPADWHSLVQGQILSTQVKDGFRTSRFKEIYPQEEIYLIAGPFFIYDAAGPDGKNVHVFLRKADPALAQNFLTLSSEYIKHYSEILGPYPYSSFTVVENFWETGYGMPGFTLLGPSVIRLPFILNTSLPHEVLHNWWGNSVYVDYEKGNWCEGLTNYMADHWQQEKTETDRQYRLNALIAYDDFVANNPHKDFPLRKFKDRHSASSEAVGYSKSMMLFHMLDFRFGKEVFNQAVQSFYQEMQFQKATFADIQKSFENRTNQNLEGFFSQWLDREGAPILELPDIKVLRWLDGSYSTSYILNQLQGVPYELSVPVIWELESGEKIHQLAKMNQRSEIYSLVTHSRPIKISVDPDFHVFRKIYTEERPATLSSIFGNPLIHFYFVSTNSAAEKWAHAWAQKLEGKSIFHKVDIEGFEWPQQGAVVLLGELKVFADIMKNQLADQKYDMADGLLKIQDQDFKLNEVSTVLVTRNLKNSQQPLSWIRWSPDNNPEEWANRLTHYGNFGVLVFKGRPAALKSTWPVQLSPLQRKL